MDTLRNDSASLHSSAAVGWTSGCQIVKVTRWSSAARSGGSSIHVVFEVLRLGVSKLFALVPLVERDLLNLRLHEQRHYSLEFVGLAMPGNARTLTHRASEQLSLGAVKEGNELRVPIEPINLEHPILVLYTDVARTAKLPGQSIANLLGVSANETISKWLVANGSSR